MPKIVMSAEYGIGSELEAPNGDFDFEIEVPKTWDKWNDKRKSNWIERNYKLINDEANNLICVAVNHDRYKDTIESREKEDCFDWKEVLKDE